MANTQAGLDIVQSGCPASIRTLLRGRKIGLLTNHTGRSRDGRTTQEILHALDFPLTALFSPEHGASGTQEGVIESGTAETGLPVYSLYGESRRPTCNFLADVTAFVCDIQDVGARFYTYATTLAYCMEACAARGIPVVVLDRPNPLGGETIEGPAVDEDQRSFVGYLRVPVRHGLTLGELARWHQRDTGLDLDLHIVEAEGWHRTQSWPQTGLTWPVPSPNLPDYESAAWYPGACLLEFSGVSVGRGTPAPFQIVGAPWLHSSGLIHDMKNWPSTIRDAIIAEPIEFTPSRATFEGDPCHGVHFKTAPATGHTVPERPVALGLALLSTLHRLHPDEFDVDKMQAALPLLGSKAVLALLQAGDMQSALDLSELDAASYREKRQSILLYQ